MIDVLRFLLVEFSPFIKRIFYFNSSLFYLMATIPLIALIPSKVNLNRVIVVTFLILFVYVHVGLNQIKLYIPLLYIWGFSFVWMKKVELSILMPKLYYFFVLALSYGLYQKLFGYTGFEMGWLNSGLSAVSLNNFSLEDIRPFSFFAGVPEFALICSVLAFYYLTVKRKLLFVLFTISLVLIGSRGMIIAQLISLSVWALTGMNFKAKVILAMFIGYIVYIIIAVVYPLYEQQIWSLLGFDSSSRLAVYGTFNARLISAELILSKMNTIDFYIYGTHIEGLISKDGLSIDSYYLRIINDFGLLVLVFISLYIINSVKTNQQSYIVSMFFVYGFFGEPFFSLFLIFIYFLFYYSSNSGVSDV